MSNMVTIRPATMEDMAEVVNLLNRESIALTGEADLSESDLRREWTEPGTDISRDTRVAVDTSGRYLGFADFSNNREPHVRPFAYCCIDPAHVDSWDWTPLLQWAESRAREDIPRAPEGAKVTLSSGTFENDLTVLNAWKAAGFVETRRFYEMQIDFETAPEPAAIPAGYSIRPMAPEDEQTVYAAMQEAFADHYGFVKPTSPEAGFSRWKHFLIDGEDTDRDMLLIAVSEGGDIAGGSLSRPSHGGDKNMGWVNSLAVGREHRRIGLGEALLRRSFEVFYEKGKKRAGLGVDASSLTNATRLYRKCGMREKKVFVDVSKVLREGRELANVGE